MEDTKDIPNEEQTSRLQQPAVGGSANELVRWKGQYPQTPDFARSAVDGYAEAFSLWDRAADEDRPALLAWAMACSTTNCSWQAYGVAQVLIRDANDRPLRG